MKKHTIGFQPASDQSILVHFGHEISLETHREIVSFLKLLEAEPIQGIVNLHPAYCSVLVKFDPSKFTHAEIESSLAPHLARLEKVKLPKPRLRQIPVCYGGHEGPDLDDVASLHGLSVDEVIHLHSSATYTSYFLGFVPGFAYLGGLPAELATPRLESPRKKVPAGSVAIGGNQTGVYPVATPGGWRLIGRTPRKMLDPQAKHMSFLEAGDQVRFVPISQKEFREWDRE
ncbi:MAG TPA: 5-oxoprolinase subunit PxpB [Candidatus Acidoferrum sp.]|nr:5-oxoprolinase subunit PxpB [Candidatus Acidoferrum sp.]